VLHTWYRRDKAEGLDALPSQPRFVVNPDPFGEHGEAEQCDGREHGERRPGERLIVPEQVGSPDRQPGHGQQQVSKDHQRGSWLAAGCRSVTSFSIGHTANMYSPASTAADHVIRGAMPTFAHPPCLLEQAAARCGTAGRRGATAT
jgi:hypothetical protein